MVNNLDPQVQIRIIDLAQEWMAQMKPVFPKSRSIEFAMATRIELFDKLYKAIAKSVTSESVRSE